MKKLILALAISTLVIAAGSALGAAPNGPSISFAGSSVSVAGVPPGHDVLVFSVARESRRYWVDVVIRQRILSGSPQESRSWDLAQPIPPKSIWCAIDLSTADYAIGAPPGFDPLPLPAPAFLRESSGTLESVEHDRLDTMIILVRPGSGAWLVRSAHGGATDNGHGKDRTALRFERMQPLTGGGPPPPKAIRPNDTIIVIDSLYAGVWSGTVGKEIQP